MRGPETEKAHKRRVRDGFIATYLLGTGIDIGFRGSVKDAEPVVSWATGVDTDFPGYDGKRLPFADNSLDFVYSSHCLEHVDDYKSFINENYRVVKENGYIIICVPHKFLYEKKENLPSKWNGDHKRYYTGASLLKEIEESLVPNSYRLLHLKDCDEKFDYNIGPDSHSCGEYQLECVLKKIKPPTWSIK